MSRLIVTRRAFPLEQVQTLMTEQIALLLLILVGTMILLSFEWVSADVIGLGVMVALILTGLLPADEAFAGFGSDTVLMILGLLIMTAALVRTGVVDIVGRTILRRVNVAPSQLILVVMVAAASLSAFLSNTASTAFFLPVVLGLANRLKTSPSRLLMPLAFATILASSLTLVSTSTNLVVSGIMTEYGLEPMGMFELTPVGLPVVIVGVLYMYVVGMRLVPDRTPPGSLINGGEYAYMTEVVILPESPLIGQTLGESRLGSELDLTVLRIVRQKKRYLTPGSHTILEEGDLLLVEGLRDDILKIKDRTGIDLKADSKFPEPDGEGEEIQMAEVIVMPGSPLIGRTLKGFRFRERFNVQVLAINRRSETIRRKLSGISLKVGDTLLVQGSADDMGTLLADDTLRLISSLENARPNTRRAPLAISIFVGVLALASLNILSIPVAVILGALLIFATKCITPQEAYRRVEWTIIILIGSMLALGVAMERTGAAEYLASLVVQYAGGLGGLGLLTAFFLLAVILTQPMSNQAAAIVLLPVAIQTANQLGLNPRTFAMMIAVAASCSYITPLEPACLMVYAPGRYRFADFVKVGALLTMAIYGIAIILVPMVWPLAVE